MSGNHTAFFYGTLMAPEVFYGVCYGQSKPAQEIQSLHTFSPAVLADHCRHRVQFADYPGVVPEQGQSVKGIFATGLTDANVQKLDFFEGSEYEKRTEKVKILKTVDGKEAVGETVETAVYIYLVPDQLERGEWDFEGFKRDKMQMWTRGDWVFDEVDNANDAT